MANGCHREKEREKWHYGAGRQRKKERHFKDGEIQAWTSTEILRPNTEGGGRRLKYTGQNVATTKRAEPAVNQGSLRLTGQRTAWPRLHQQMESHHQCH